VAPNAVTDTARTGARIPLEEASPSTGTTIHAPADGAGPLALAEFIRLGASFVAETPELFAAVRDHDLPTLAARCDDDLGSIDIDPSGGAEVIRDRAGWEVWFVRLSELPEGFGQPGCGQLTERRSINAPR
jgi:hypothetical protein